MEAATNQAYGERYRAADDSERITNAAKEIQLVSRWYQYIGARQPAEQDDCGDAPAEQDPLPFARISGQKESGTREAQRL